MAMLNENLRLAFKFNANGFPAFAGNDKNGEIATFYESIIFKICKLV